MKPKKHTGYAKMASFCAADRRRPWVVSRLWRRRCLQNQRRPHRSRLYSDRPCVLRRLCSQTRSPLERMLADEQVPGLRSPRGMLFSAKDVRTLGSPCDDGPAPGIEIYFDEDSHSIILDFSKVTHADRFPKSDFEGYMLEVALEEANGTLLVVTVDRELSSISLDDDHVDSDRSHIDLKLPHPGWRRALQIDSMVPGRDFPSPMSELVPCSRKLVYSRRVQDHRRLRLKGSRDG